MPIFIWAFVGLLFLVGTFAFLAYGVIWGIKFLRTWWECRSDL